jgi:arginyl-tRNA synthetase
MFREEIKNLIEKAIKKLQKDGVFPAFEIPEIKIDNPENKDWGDYSTNIAMLAKQDPQKIANAIKADFLEKVEIKNGFINFFLSKEYLQKQISEILKQKKSFGKLRPGRGWKVNKVNKVNIEFISANPTGPLTLANGRGGFCGDVLVNVLEKAGYKTEREYYINDAGEQVKKLGHSVLGDSEAVYKGPYVEDLKGRIREKDAEKAGKEAAKIILKEMIKPSVKKMGINFDNWFFEQSLYDKKEVDKVLKFLKDKNLTYEQEGAVWFKTTQFGDDKDRVLIKAGGEKTYLASDIAYLKSKFSRGFEKLILFLGADHYGYINRIKAAAVALGYKKEQVDVIIMQLVKLIQGGQEMKMSKRSGIYVTMDELLEEVGLDVARFFFLSRQANSHLNFDLDLAKEQSDKNPVYYVQYAHARICSILKKAGDKKEKKINYAKLNHSAELDLIKQLIRLPEIIEDTEKDYQVQRLPQYATDLAISFHKFYHECQVISEDKELTGARISLISAARIVLENTLKLMGVTAPEKM